MESKKKQAIARTAAVFGVGAILAVIEKTTGAHPADVFVMGAVGGVIGFFIGFAYGVVPAGLMANLGKGNTEKGWRRTRSGRNARATFFTIKGGKSYGQWVIVFGLVGALIGAFIGINGVVSDIREDEARAIEREAHKAELAADPFQQACHAAWSVDHDTHPRGWAFPSTDECRWDHDARMWVSR